MLIAVIVLSVALAATLALLLRSRGELRRADVEVVRLGAELEKCRQVR